MSVHVHVERVVLDGIALGAGGADALRDAIAEAIGHALAASPLGADLAAGGARPSLRAATDVRLPAATLDRGSAIAAGAAIGESVGRGLTGCFETQRHGTRVAASREASVRPVAATR